MTEGRIGIPKVGTRTSQTRIITRNMAAPPQSDSPALLILKILPTDLWYRLTEGAFQFLAFLFELAHPVTDLDELYGAE